MSEEDRHFIEKYEELLDKGYCDCNEMNCIDNNSPRRILNIVKDLQQRIDKTCEYIISEYYKEYTRPLEHLNLKNCTYEPSLIALSILKGENNE